MQVRTLRARQAAEAAERRRRAELIARWLRVRQWRAVAQALARGVRDQAQDFNLYHRNDGLRWGRAINFDDERKRRGLNLQPTVCQAAALPS
jgi:ribosomal 50S subunit-associated protein YjgA (DUF615 family)